MRFEIPTTANGQFNFPNGTIKHYKDGKKQGIVTFPNGVKKHYHNNTLHNSNGPAIIYPNGKTEWYLHGIHIATVWYKEQWCENKPNIVHRDVTEGCAIVVHVPWREGICDDIYNDVVSDVDNDDEYNGSDFVVDNICYSELSAIKMAKQRVVELTAQLAMITGKKVFLI